MLGCPCLEYSHSKATASKHQVKLVDLSGTVLTTKMLPSLPGCCAWWFTIALCAVFSPYYQGVAGTVGLQLSETDKNLILQRHNVHRRTVQPSASDMLESIWDDQLATFAQEIAEDCTYDIIDTTPFMDRGNFSYDIGINQAINQQAYGTNVNYVQLINSWNAERQFYDYSLNSCNPHCTCDKFLQLVWASSCYVGCGVSHCSQVMGFQEPNAVLFVCLYGPAGVIVDQPPYTAGSSCDVCPSDRPVCNSGLCAPPDEMMMMGSDPHFSVLLSCGHMLCFSVQGEEGKIFNLLNDDVVEINALFVSTPDHPDNTYLGSVGVNYFLKEHLYVTFTARNNIVNIKGRTDIPAHTISKITFKRNQVSISENNEPLRNSKRHVIRVEVSDLELQFSVRFVQQTSIDIVWHEPRGLSSNIGGLIGQFFRSGIELDAGNHTLYLPGQAPVPVKLRPIWKFMAREVPDDPVCWTTIKPSNQGQGLIQGTYKDYEVQNLVQSRVSVKLLQDSFNTDLI